MGLGWIRFFPGDWRGSATVGAMSAVERIVYLELLLLEAAGGPFLWDSARISRQIRLTQAECEEAWPAIRDRFDLLPDGRYSNPKMASEVVRANDKSEQARNARNSRKPPPEPTDVPTDVGTDVPTDVVTTPTPTPIRIPNAIETSPASPAGSTRKSRKPPSTDAQRVWENFRTLFVARHGEPPTESQHYFVQITAILRKGASVEGINQRLTTYFDHPPFSLREGARDFGRFLKNYDMLAPTTNGAVAKETPEWAVKLKQEMGIE